MTTFLLHIYIAIIDHHGNGYHGYALMLLFSHLKLSFIQKTTSHLSEKKSKDIIHRPTCGKKGLCQTHVAYAIEMEG